MAVYKIENGIQKYAWGSSDGIPGLLGIDNSANEPMAELWMGAHPKLPSKVLVNGGKTELNRFIAEEPARTLGPETAERFSKRLPFLFKVLAAGSPLSIQAHPSLEQAAAGYQRENEAGVPLDAFNRNYKDDNHKPEIICALSEYHAMCGFRPLSGIVANFRMIDAPVAAALAAVLETGMEMPEFALKTFFTKLMTLEGRLKEELITAAVAAAVGSLSLSGAALEAEAFWIKRFAELYPGDIGILSPLYLNLVTLEPGEALFLPAGELHAYLGGLGMELMANSDNVLRGGLTPKHVDVSELLSTLSFGSGEPEILHPVRLSDFEAGYSTPAPEFRLSRIDLPEGAEYEPVCKAGMTGRPSIIICTEGGAEVTDETGRSTDLHRGDAVFITFEGSALLRGSGVFFRASVPCG